MTGPTPFPSEPLPLAPAFTMPAQGGYAFFWSRVGATLLDNLIAFLVVGVPTVLTALLTLHTSHLDSWGPYAHAGVPQPNCTLDWHGMVCDDGSRILVNLGLVLAVYLTTAALWYLYVSTATSRSGSTIGYRAAGIKVVSVTDATSSIHLGRAVLRTGFTVAITILNFLIPFIGIVNLLDILWMLWDPRRQTLHDKVANSVVVYR